MPLLSPRTRLVLLTCGAAASYLLYRVSRIKRSQAHDWRTALKHYAGNVVLHYIGRAANSRLIKDSRRGEFVFVAFKGNNGQIRKFLRSSEFRF